MRTKRVCAFRIHKAKSRDVAKGLVEIYMRTKSVCALLIHKAASKGTRPP